MVAACGGRANGSSRVSNAEVQAILEAGLNYTVKLGGVEGKYFYRTAEQALKMAQRSYATYGPQTLTSMRLSAAALRNAGVWIADVAREGEVTFVPGSMFPLGPVQIWSFFPFR